MAYFDRWEFYIFLKIWKLKNILLYLYYVCDIRSHSKLMLSWCKGIYTKFICKAKDFYEFVFCVDSFIFFLLSFKTRWFWSSSYIFAAFCTIEMKIGD